MSPTLRVGDLVWTDRDAYTAQERPRRGDIIVFPTWDGNAELTKRVVGFPGEVIEQRGNDLYLNGRLQPTKSEGTIDLGCGETALLYTENLEGVSHSIIMKKSEGGLPQGKWVVPEGELFVMGDNRDQSMDSRTQNAAEPKYGVHALEANVLGRVDRILYASPKCSHWVSFSRSGVVRVP